MKKNTLPFLFIALFIIAVVVGFASTSSNNLASEDSMPTTLSEEASDEAFDKMMQVLTHKRCVNCHPSDNHPRQGEDSHVHNFGVLRGDDDHGPESLKCNACHQNENNDYSGVPGAPGWGLAPIGMAWQGLSRVEIAQSILDPSKNGGMDLPHLVEHLTEHELVLWAWEPGVNAEGIPREKPPVSKEEYIKAVKDWVAAGTPIPAK